MPIPIRFDSINFSCGFALVAMRRAGGQLASIDLCKTNARGPAVRKVPILSLEAGPCPSRADVALFATAVTRAIGGDADYSKLVEDACLVLVGA